MPRASKKIAQSAFVIFGIASVCISFFIFGNTKLEAAQSKDSQTSHQEPQQPPAMPVQVEITGFEVNRTWKQYSARLTAVDYALIKPQVNGTITEVRFEDGQMVNKGDILFVIDPRPFEAALAQAQAEVNAAQSQSSYAQKELKRAQSLIKTQAVSQRLVDERANASKVAANSLKSANARLEQAKIDLDYAYVKAPIAGRIGRAEITEGNLVQAGPNAPVLTSIVSSEGIYADFDVDEQTYLGFVRSSAKDKLAESKIPVELSLGSDDKNLDPVTYNGFIHSFDNRIDPTTSTIRARAMFENKDGSLLPGMFARIKMGTPSEEEKITVSERAIGTNQDRKFVYVVDASNKTTYREVQVGESMNGRRIILSGLNAGEKVVSDGIIRIRPDMPVAPQIAKTQNIQTLETQKQ